MLLSLDASHLHILCAGGVLCEGGMRKAEGSCLGGEDNLMEREGGGGSSLPGCSCIAILPAVN